VPEY